MERLFTLLRPVSITITSSAPMTAEPSARPMKIPTSLWQCGDEGDLATELDTAGAAVECADNAGLVVPVIAEWSISLVCV